MGWFSKRKGTRAGATAGAEYTVMPEALRRAAASLKGHAFVPDNEVTKVSAEEVFPISAAIVRGDRLREVALKEAEEEALKNPRAGQLIAGRGIYLGLYEPKDRDGKSIGKKYRAFAAPEDLKDAAGNKLVLTFRDTAKEISKLRNWNGHNGGDYENDTALYDALRSGSYNGEWIIPPLEFLHGKAVDGNPVTVPNLLTNKDTGAFAGTFTLTNPGSSDFMDRYWSLSEDSKQRDYVRCVRLSDGNDGWFLKFSYRLACRAVRLELVI